MQTKKNKINSIFKKLFTNTVYYQKMYYALIKSTPYSMDDVIRMLNTKRIFFLTSTGRTGTTLFAKMLNSLHGFYVEHEPVVREQYSHRLALENPKFSFAYIKEFRLKEIYIRLKNRKGILRYGETNGAIRRNLKDIKYFLPECRLVQIVRDGRDTISSVLNRHTFTEKDKFYFTMIPHKSIIDNDKWASFNRFQKIASMWCIDNSYMRKNCDFTVRFEDLITDYEYAKFKLFEPLDIEINYAIWKNFVDQKMNPRGKNRSRFSYTSWTKEEKQFFWNECGNEMQIYGYNRN
ncbi:MAG: sulfotransferase [Desulfobacterales bacterium]|nr:sulfotransferase [Desulfobacterales bacterium]